MRYYIKPETEVTVSNYPYTVLAGSTREVTGQAFEGDVTPPVGGEEDFNHGNGGGQGEDGTGNRANTSLWD